ncbi:uncharacterized protein PHACADRAFT_252784 [Phanerochaete carnosa HHB-10118-sp]|uniref:Uncharacterized protein n=1 Tax=Phanerochaete carnosa (strain HHB-10118-sp) TaxID=650164 RepID=K5W3L0_PHACS|nr:uncharacterized protein PHACADRAFT_252784 [Phanerochaete carnosa HHB-10118-sp]EKM58453.1 hypothetical protein PHACADRAFT_252784 [Phanerochaete carnosa HHB-10118-sp]
MSNTDTMVSLDPEDSAQILEMVEELSFETLSPIAPDAVFGSARKRSLSKSKEPSRRDSQTLPWKTSMRHPNARKESIDVNSSSPPSQPSRSESPDIDTILAKTPRPRRTSSVGLFLSPHSRNNASPTARQDGLPEQSLSSIYSSLFGDESDGEGGGSESDSSIDIHTPLP